MLRLLNAFRRQRRQFDFVPQEGVVTSPTNSRFPDFRVVLENTDLEYILRGAKSMGYKPGEIVQTEYDGHSGHIRLYRSESENQKGLFAAITSEEVSHSLVYRLYVPVTESTQVPRAITR